MGDREGAIPESIVDRQEARGSDHHFRAAGVDGFVDCRWDSLPKSGCRGWSPSGFVNVRVAYVRKLSVSDI